VLAPEDPYFFFELLLSVGQCYYLLVVSVGARALVVDVVSFDQRQHRTSIGACVQVIALEVVVLEDGALAFLAGDDLVEAVHVELPDEGEEVVVLEVLGEDLGGQPSDILYDECLAVLSPSYYVSVLRVLTRTISTSTMR
jgi:hypothetical protein